MYPPAKWMNFETHDIMIRYNLHKKNTETVGFGAERAESTPIACVPLLKRLHNQAPEPCSPTRQGPEQASQF